MAIPQVPRVIRHLAMRRVAVTALVTVVWGSLALMVACGPDAVGAQDVLDGLPPDSPRPTLLFAIPEVPALRDKVRSNPVARGAFEQMKRRADGFLPVDTTRYVFHGSVAGRALTTQALNLAMTGYTTGDPRYLDKAKAIVLKRELDRWDLYKLYEDRFLDLFKESQ